MFLPWVDAGAANPNLARWKDCGKHEKIIRYGFYPLLLLGALGILGGVLHLQWDMKKSLWIYLLGLLTSMIAVESIFPLDGKWKMTGASFLRDLKYLVFGGLSIGAVRTLFGTLSIHFSEMHHGLLADVPVWAAVPIYLLVFEFIQYHFHRYSHEGPGEMGRFFWRTHAAHHLPNQVYVVMHGVFHPINAVMTALIVQAPLLLLGLSPQAVFAATLLIDLQTMISHCNADLRVGFWNFVLVGPELHRRHHSADAGEGKNYGAVLPWWDLLLGTFRYAPGFQPQRLGVERPEEYPDSSEVGKVLALPFRSFR